MCSPVRSPRAPRVDVFVSADHAQMDVAAKSGRLVAGSIRDLLSNTLVVVVPPGVPSTGTLHAAGPRKPRITRVALGNPDSVPAGVYARQWLERAGLWAAVSREGRARRSACVRRWPRCVRAASTPA